MNRIELFLALILVLLNPWPVSGAGTNTGEDALRHPEELWASRDGSLPDGSAVAGPAGPKGTLWTSMSFAALWTGIAVGDLDGDGRRESALLGGHEISILRHTGRGLYKDFEIPLPSGLRFLSIDSADINANGREEIFVSAVREDYRPSALVLEWNPDKGRFVQTHGGLDWFLRIVKPPGRQERVLLGQRGDRVGIFAARIEALQWIAGEYRPASDMAAPRGANVFGLAYGDPIGIGKRQSIHFTAEDRLRLSIDGSEEWTSAESYGGSESFLFPPQDWAEANRLRRDGDPLPENPLYLPQRLIVEDLDGDGRQELLVVKNEDAANRLFARLRLFGQGRFICLDWDTVGLSPKWRTRAFTGYISDYAWADIDNDGRMELAFVVVVGRERIGLGRDKSHIVVWKDSAFKAKPDRP